MLNALVCWVVGSTAIGNVESDSPWELLVSVATERMCKEYGKNMLLCVTLHNSGDRSLTAYQPGMYSSLHLVSVDDTLPISIWRVRPSIGHTEFTSVPSGGALLGIIDPSQMFDLTAAKEGAYRVQVRYRDSAANNLSERHRWGVLSSVGELSSAEFELVLDRAKRVVAIKLPM